MTHRVWTWYHGKNELEERKYFILFNKFHADDVQIIVQKARPIYAYRHYNGTSLSSDRFQW